jgi:hypothetical protein
VALSNHYKAADAKAASAFMNNIEAARSATADTPSPASDYCVLLPSSLDTAHLQWIVENCPERLEALNVEFERACAATATTRSADHDYSDAVDVKSMREALKTPYVKEWLGARDSEIGSMKDNGVMEEVDYKDWMKPLVDSKLVFKVKRNPDGTLDKFKVRWVARGFTEIFDRHYTETYSPVASLNLVRLLLCIFAARPLVKVYQADVRTAFLHPKLREKIFMKPMPFMDLPEGKVFKLLKTIYGLKQSSMEWFKDIKSTILSLGYIQSEYDACLFISGDPSSGIFSLLVVYVDDILCFTNSPDLWTKAFHKMHTKYGLDDLGELHFYRGLQFVQDHTQGTWTISQPTYIQEIIDAAGMTDAKGVASPEDGTILSAADCADDAFMASKNYAISGFRDYAAFHAMCRKIQGMCVYASSCFRPDLAHALKGPARGAGTPGQAHWDALKRIVRYLQATKNLGLTLQGPRSSPILHLFSDADDANNIDDRRSISSTLCAITDDTYERFAFYYWYNPSQTKTARSSTESEIMAIDTCHRAGLHERALLAELCFPQPPTRLAIDNTAAITIMTGTHPGKYSGVKHIARRFFACQEERLLGHFLLFHISGERNPSDLGCAYKSPAHHQYLRDLVLGRVHPVLTCTAMCAYLARL